MTRHTQRLDFCEHGYLEATRDADLITDAHVATSWIGVDSLERYAKSEREELEKTPFNRARAAKKNLKVLRKHGKVIGVPIPYDPRFID